MSRTAELERAEEMLRALNPPDAEGVEDFRRAFEEMCEGFPLPNDAEIVEVDDQAVKGLWVGAPNASTERTLLFFHSGGYCTGSTHAYREFCYALSRAADARVFAVEYRLAPENTHPAALQDAVAAYRWLAEHRDPAHLVLVGDSAGGGLVVATLVELRDGGDDLPAGGICISPFADLAGEGESMTTNAERDPLVTPDLVGAMAGMYLGEKDRKTPSASPIYADLYDLPPLLVMVGSAECLLDDATRLAGRVRENGGEAELEVYDDMPHVWPLFSSFLPEGREALERIGHFVDERVPSGVG